MTTLGEAFIEVHADTKPFARELGPKLKTILDVVGTKGKVQARSAGKKITEGLDEGIAKRFPILGTRFKTLGNFIDKLRDRIDKKGGLRDAFEKLSKGNFILTRLFGEFALGVGKAVKVVGRLGKGMFSLLSGIDLVMQGVAGLAIEGFKTLIGVGGDFARVQSTLALGFTKIGTALAAAAAEAIAAAPAVAALVAVIAALGAALAVLFFVLATIIAPFATLVNLLLGLPAVITLVLSVLFPLILALKDLDKVFKALNEKDPKKFAEDLKALPPVMRELVAALKPFKKRWDELVTTIQTAFFGPIFAKLGPAMDQVLRTLMVGGSAVASALGEVIANVLSLLADPKFAVMIQDFMLTLADFIRANAPMLKELIAAFGAAAQAALPIVLELLNKFGGFLLQFAAWIMGAITDGSFEKWLNDGIDALKTIWNLVKALIGLFSALFSKLKGDGKDFLNIITEAINNFTNWVKSPEGQHALENMGKLAKIIAEGLKIALGIVIHIAERISHVVDAINWINNHTGNPLGKVGKIVGGLAGYSGGGVVPRDQVAMVHKGEPILDPANPVAKNRAILSSAGMLDVLEPQATVVNVFIGNEQLDARTDYRIAQSNRRTARALATGPRS